MCYGDDIIGFSITPRLLSPENPTLLATDNLPRRAVWLYQPGKVFMRWGEPGDEHVAASVHANTSLTT